MVILNDYLYSGDTVLRILQKYMQDLRKEAKETHNEIDLAHCNFLIQIMELLEHNDFLTAQSQKIREFYKYMAREYPYLSFTFKGAAYVASLSLHFSIEYFTSSSQSSKSTNSRLKEPL